MMNYKIKRFLDGLFQRGLCLQFGIQTRLQIISFLVFGFWLLLLQA